MYTIITLHSYWRWLIMLVAVGAAIRFLIGWLQKQIPTPRDRTLMLAWSVMLDIQTLLGVILLVGLGTYSIPQLQHMFTMVIAVIIPHLAIRWRQAMNANVFRNNLIVIGVVILLVIGGTLLLPGDRWILR